MRSDSNRYVRGFGTVMAAAVGAAAMTWATAIFAQSAKPAYFAAFPNFAPKLTPQLPGDVDIAFKTQLEKAGEFAKVQREFESECVADVSRAQLADQRSRSTGAEDQGHPLRAAALDAMAQQQRDL